MLLFLDAMILYFNYTSKTLQMHMCVYQHIESVLWHFIGYFDIMEHFIGHQYDMYRYVSTALY